MTEEDEEIYREKTFVDVLGKKIESDEVRGHCHLTGKYRGPVHRKRKTIVTKKQCSLVPFTNHIFSNYRCHLFLKRLVVKKILKKLIVKTDEEFISITYGCSRFIDRYKFLSTTLVSLVKKLVDKSLETLKNLKEQIFDNDEILKIVNEIKIIFKEDRYNNDSTKDTKKRLSR